MREAREAGATWTEIGEALGMPKQGAHDWFRRKIENQEMYVAEFHDPEFCYTSCYTRADRRPRRCE